MNKQELIDKIEDLREEGESDLRTVIYFAKQLDEPSREECRLVANEYNICSCCDYNMNNLIKDIVTGCDKADAEWDLEFDNVEKRIKIKFVKPKPFREIENEICMYNFHGFAMYKYAGDIKLYEDSDSYAESSIIFEKPFNEENYTEACRLIEKLFMGEE